MYTVQCGEPKLRIKKIGHFRLGNTFLTEYQISTQIVQWS